MNFNLKIIIKYISVFMVLIAIELGLLVAVALIPKEHIRDNVHESALYLTSKEVFFKANNLDKSSVIDRYADSILLGIAYSYNENEPVKSVMKSGYYHQDTANENYNLLAAVEGNLEPNYEYSRYWHGSIAIVRPMLTIFNVKQLYINLYIITFLAIICLVFFAKKYVNFKIALGIILSFLLVSIWYVPLSLEYIWTFLIMLFSSIMEILMFKNGRRNFYVYFFTIGGVTAYFDFLTTETITLLYPLILLLVMMESGGELRNFKNGIKFTTFTALNWALGYVLTFVSKWGIASIVLEKNCFSEALSQAGYRIGGNTENITFAGKILSSLARNISCLFPFSYMGKSGFGFAILTLIAVLVIFYLFRNNKKPVYFPALMFIIGVIPYIRYIILNNHSYIHYFFTYRAQVTTILCLYLALSYGITIKNKRR